MLVSWSRSGGGPVTTWGMSAKVVYVRITRDRFVLCVDEKTCTNSSTLIAEGSGIRHHGWDCMVMCIREKQ